MIFKVDENSKELKLINEEWKLPELKLEELILSTQTEGTPVLNDSLFNEELMIINNQVRTRDKKRADILAIDKYGNGVIVELKKDVGSLGVDTQALQYLADFSKYTGAQFLEKFLSKGITQDDVFSFLGNDVLENDINKNNRIILVARSFDSTLFSMGEWLSTKNIGFRCISYQPILTKNEKFINFSISFDRAPESIYPLEFIAKIRQPKIIWHNIGGTKDNKWWNYLKTNNQIAASFECKLGDKGEKLLKNYIVGDRIVAYVGGKGAIGYGKIVKNPISSYQLFKKGSKEDVQNGYYLHRINIKWISVADNIDDALSSKTIKEDFEIYHPVSTSASIDNKKGEKLLKKLEELFRKEG